MSDARRLLEDGLALQRRGELDAALALYEAAELDPEPEIVALALRHQAGVFRMRSRWEEALAAARRSGEIASAHDLRDHYADAINSEASVYQLQGDFDRASALLSSIPGIADDPKRQGVAYQNLGSIAAQRGDFPRARHFYQKSHRCFQRAGFPHGEAVALNNFGRAALDHGNARIAEPMLRDALATARRVGDGDLTALVKRNLAEAKLCLDMLGEARTLAEEAQTYFALHDNLIRCVECLRLAGDIARREQALERAAMLYEEGLSLAVKLDAQLEVTLLTARLRALSECVPSVPVPPDA